MTYQEEYELPTREEIINEIININYGAAKMKSWKKGRIYENNIAHGYGKRQPGSGSQSTAKEDVKGEEEFSKFLFQTKNSEGNKSYSIKREDLQTLRHNAFKVGKIGIFAIRFAEREEYFVLKREDFDFLFGELDEQ